MGVRYYFFVSMALLFHMCDDSTSVSPIEEVDQRPYTAEDSAEGYNVALWYDGDYLPSANSVSYFMRTLFDIREKWSDTIPSLLSRRFSFPWVPGQIFIEFSDAAIAQVNGGTYTGWDVLPDHLRPDSIVKYPSSRSSWGGVSFLSPYNPHALSETYSGLEGVNSAIPVHRLIMGSANYPLVAGTIDSQMVFIFEEYSSLLIGQRYCFKEVQDSIRYLGSLVPYDTTYVEWEEEVRSVIDQFGEWNGE